jgi:predicted DNA-binding mobile mystery protein A
MISKTLKIDQLAKKAKSLKGLENLVPPPTGWIKTIRLALGMSARQLGDKLHITRQGVQEMEKREKDGAITIQSLREVARALDMNFVYGFVPKDGTFEALIDRKARELATRIVLRTSQSMQLEDQENSPQRIQKAIEERTEAIKKEIPKTLWD